jgi:hypothetical protein
VPWPGSQLLVGNGRCGREREGVANRSQSRARQEAALRGPLQGRRGNIAARRFCEQGRRFVLPVRAGKQRAHYLLRAGDRAPACPRTCPRDGSPISAGRSRFGDSGDSGDSGEPLEGPRHGHVRSRLGVIPFVTLLGEAELLVEVPGRHAPVKPSEVASGNPFRHSGPDKRAEETTGGAREAVVACVSREQWS